MTPRFVPRARRAGLTLALCVGVTGCAIYASKPLPNAVSWKDPARLRVDARRIALPALASQSIDLDAPLTLQGVAALAVLNDPRLQALRARVGVARAQAFEAGLLPDPTFSAAREVPQGNGGGVTSTAFKLGLQFDLGRLITRGAAVSAARAHLQQVDLHLLWQEWQTAAAAERDYVELAALRERDALLREQLGAAAQRLRRDRAAQAAGIEARTTADADLVELQSLRKRLGADARRQASAMGALDALLGLRPGTPLRLVGLPPYEPAAVADASNNLPRLATIRPDLRALRAGYASQEQRLREAVLSQFPSVSIGLSRARDTSDVNTLGFGVTLKLPLLNDSRGVIAVQSATRGALYDEYVLRLRQTRAQVEQLLVDIRLLRRQQRALRSALAPLHSAALVADASLRRGDMTLPQAQAQRRAWLDQRLALLANEQQTAQQTVALQLLTGSGVFRPAVLR
ncbi:outer membrane efflux protein [mine drainage metagenome]|jgi:outer membrane protein TolC|uniref:Outer membrane efflux protein n=1 Tax=mine drainage metagenome TaxID=410659 RepID=A0A1J5R7W6_9ZZZZ